MNPSITTPVNTSPKSPRRSGQIIILFAFFFIFILGIFIANYNIGDLVRQKIQLQNAADAASIAAARSLGLGMGFLVLVNDMVLIDLTLGITKLIADLAVPIIGWALVIPDALVLALKLDSDFLMADSYLIAGPYLAQEAAAVVGYANGAEFAWALLDDSWSGVSTGSGAKLTLNVPDPGNWTSLYSNMFFHLIWPRLDQDFSEKAVVVAWNLRDEPVAFGQDYLGVRNKNLYAVSSSTIYYVPQALTNIYESHHDVWLPGDDYNGRMEQLTPEWYIWAPWFAGPFWWPRLIPNNDFNADEIGLPLFSSFDSAFSKMMSSNVGLGLESGDVLGMIQSFSSTFDFLGDAMEAINNVGGNAI